MLEDIWMAISVGRRVIKTIAALKSDVDSFRSRRAKTQEHHAQMEALDKRASDLERLAREQDDRLRQIENSLKDTLIATEAVAERVGTIYWIAVAGCALSVAGADPLGALVCAATLGRKTNRDPGGTGYEQPQVPARFGLRRAPPLRGAPRT